MDGEQGDPHVMIQEQDLIDMSLWSRDLKGSCVPLDEQCRTGGMERN